ncbi:MAG: A-macroglobulin complement component [Myxococcaceae bacterium]|nr:A-macroglobulin complement component [Myxococcaceae bacterium]
MHLLRFTALAVLVVVSLAGAPPPVKDPATTQRVGGPTRFLSSVSTDKSIYKVNETVFVRGVVLDANTHVPAPNGTPAQIVIKGSKGEVLTQGQSVVQDGAFGFSYPLGPDAPGGEYRVEARGAWGHATAVRRFEVRAYRPPRLTSQITFLREGYGPGDSVSATLETKRAEGGIPVGAKITVVARVDEKEISRSTTTVDASGKASVTFPLPRAIERGEGTLAFTIEDGGVLETATKTIPILVSTVDVAMYPEGGDLVAGLPSRLYLEARTPAQKPADLAGVVIDESGAEIATFRTEHEGRGRVKLTPTKGAKYSLKITEPAGIAKRFPLPPVVTDGAVITSLTDTSPAKEPVKATIAWTGDRLVTVTLRQRDRELDTVTLDAGKQKGADVSLKAGQASGVLVVTVTSKDGVPLAERLVFREPEQQLGIELKADRERYVPGAPVKLTIKTTLDGKPASAVVGVTVSDESVFEILERREQPPSLPVMVLLEADVQELADAHVYLDPKNPKAKLAVDLLLATQGWRRFALLSVQDFLTRYGDKAERALAFAQPRPRYEEFEDALAGAGPLADEGGGPRGRPMAIVKPRPMPANAAPPPMPAAPVMPAPPQPRQPAPVVVAARPPPPPPPAEKPIADRQRRADDPAPEAKKVARLEAGAGLFDKNIATGESIAFRSFVSVREFAHQVRPDRKPNDRLDFAETLYWSAAVRTNAQGEATVSFGTSDAVTSFRASVGGYTDTGVLGSATSTLKSVQPFFVEPKLPLEVTSGDVVRLPVAFVNGTKEPLANVTLALAAKGDLKFQAPAAFSLKADARERRVVELGIGAGTKTANLTLTSNAGGYQDVVTRELKVKPKGFPVEQSTGGLLTANGRASWKVTLAPDTVPGSQATSIAVFPSPAANLTQALKRLVMEPGGCFEQTSSTTYPMTMALQYFQSHSGVDAALVRDAQDKLDRGYKRLAGFECKQKGYEWFGEDPGHEALTAYGVLQFTDMKKVRPVDDAMLARTREWLLKQRDGKGGFERRRRALHVWVEDKDASDAYITWALLEGGEKSLTAEVARVKDSVKTTKNAYVVALAANVLALAGDASGAKDAMTKLAALQKDSGLVGGGTQSIVGSTGESLELETTSLAALAWMRQPAFALNVEKSMKALADSCKDGRYGATQSTVLALRAIVEFDKKKAAERKPGSVKLFVDGKPVGGAQKYDGSTQGAITFADVGELMAPGEHTLELVQEGGSPVPFSIAVRSNRVKPDSSPDTRVALDVKLGQGALKEGDVIEATARLTNLSDAPLSTVVAIVGVPGGLEPRIDQLKELVKAKTIDAYEVMGRDVVLYWRGMTPKQQVRVPVSLLAAIPGKYTGPASRAYLYYGDEHKAWVDGLAADIAAKN